ncbi:unnamed protein product [Schistocephalus solidus]|uniref:Rabphilin-3A n=1 Tax=Schistocephalus solidus TaxID=70667 RepID=A0A183SE70_SCHSO|nr:unnamed protein product [Schistocephalus solidus]
MLKRLENLTLSSAPSSKSACTLCGQEFGLLSKSANHCADCGRLVCPRCSKEFTEGRADRTPGANQTEVNEISPSRYLPPETASRMSSTERSMLLLRKFWQAHQATEKRDIRGQPLSSANGVGGGGDTTRLTRHPFRKSFSNERPSRLSQLFGSESFSTTSNLRASRPKRYHLCKLCCEARESNMDESPTGIGWAAQDLFHDIPAGAVLNPVIIDESSGCAGPVSDAKIPSFQGQTSTENTISSAFDLESPGSADGIRHVPSKESINCNPIVLHQQQQQLHCPFAVLDEDKFGADWLGEYRLGLGDLLTDRLSEFAVPLNPRKPLPKEIDDLVNPTKGRIQIALRYIEENKQLCVEVIRCADLARMDHSGSSDPFVKLYLRPDKLRKTKQKTKIKKSTLFPEFNEVFYYAMDAADVDKRTLEITVWDYDRGTTNDFIGGVTLGAKGKAERREVWQAVFRPPYRRFEAWFQLASKSEPDGESNQSARVPTPGITD